MTDQGLCDNYKSQIGDVWFQLIPRPLEPLARIDEAHPGKGYYGSHRTKETAIEMGNFYCRKSGYQIGIYVDRGDYWHLLEVLPLEEKANEKKL